ncbi:MAG: hypothetical protein VX024_03025, partial [SAR324 cluster bacterium]|nr:hypothetical protein [SAR324 cluster bacterium]
TNLERFILQTFVTYFAGKTIIITTSRCFSVKSKSIKTGFLVILMSLIVGLRGKVNLGDKQKGKSINRWRILKKSN